MLPSRRVSVIREIYLMVTRVIWGVSPEVIPNEIIFLFLRENKTTEKANPSVELRRLHVTGRSTSSVRL